MSTKAGKTVEEMKAEEYSRMSELAFGIEQLCRMGMSKVISTYATEILMHCANIAAMEVEDDA